MQAGKGFTDEVRAQIAAKQAAMWEGKDFGSVWQQYYTAGWTQFVEPQAAASAAATKKGGCCAE